LNKYIAIFVLTFLFTSVNGQDLTSSVFLNDSAKHEIQIKFQGYYHNQTISNEFTRLFYLGGYIDTTLKNKVSDNLNNQNRIGAELNWGIKFKNHQSILFGKPEWGWYASAENIGFYHSEFSKNAFDLLFYGNSRFTGDTISLSDVNFETFQYQKFTFGGFHKSNHSYVGISFLKGQNYSSFKMNKADFYTATLGQEITLDLEANFRQSDTANIGLNAFNGWGLSTDIVFYLNTGKNKNIKFQNAFKIAIQDLGFINWNNQSQFTNLDSNYYFNGFEVTDLFDSSSYNFSDRIKDSLHILPEQKSFTTLLPFSFSFSKIADPLNGEKIQGIYGVRIRAFSFYKPLFFAGLFYQPIKNLNMNIFASVGGYGGFRMGYSLYARIIKNMHLSISSTDLLGWGKNAFGKDVSIQLSYAF
jgi:hypothetical protein